MLYFAYGSNLYPARFRARVDICLPKYIAQLQGYKLRFAKRGDDGSAKCTVRKSTIADIHVIGVLYQITVLDQKKLDRSEGLGQGYDRLWVTVYAKQQQYRAYTYIANQEYVDSRLKPYDWYLRYVVEGARRHRFPATYVRQLELIEAQRDPDEKRCAVHYQALARH